MGHFVYILYGKTAVNWKILHTERKWKGKCPFLFLFKHIERLLERLIIFRKINIIRKINKIKNSNARITCLNFKSIKLKLIKFDKNITTTKSVNFIINIYY